MWLCIESAVTNAQHQHHPILSESDSEVYGNMESYHYVGIYVVPSYILRTYLQTVYTCVFEGEDNLAEGVFKSIETI